MFLPSGTMCNAIGFRLHIRPAATRGSWTAPRTRSSLRGRAGRRRCRARCCTPLDGDGGMFTADTGARRRCARRATATARARGSCRSSRRRTSAAGACGRSSAARRSSASRREHGLRTHLDGARLMNAVVASGVPAADWARGFDTAWIDFTKGLGAPVGAVLAGSRELIDEAWRYKQMMGGAMRQAGIVAAAGAVRARPPRRAARRATTRNARRARRRGWRRSRASSSTRPGRDEHRRLRRAPTRTRCARRSARRRVDRRRSTPRRCAR